MTDNDLIRRGDALKAAKLAAPNSAPMEAIAALPAQGVVDERIAGWVRRLRKTEEAGHAHHLSKADRLAIADFLAALTTENDNG